MGAGLFALMVAPRRPLVRHVYVLFPRQMEAPFDHTWPEDSYTSGPPPQGRSESEFFMTSSSSKIITRTLLTCFCNPSIMIGKESMSAAVLEAEQNGFVDLKNVLASLPSIGEQTVDSITENTILINNQCPNPRMKFIMERLIQHLHEFAKEVNLNTDEWIAGIRFLTETGQKCSDVRQEFILLSDILGLSTLVDGLSNSKPPGCTESTVLGPFHTEDAPPTEQGGSIVSSSGGKKMVVEGIVKNQNGEGIAGAQLDVWETDENGFYDVQNADRKGPDNRGIITTDESGKYQFEAIVPVAYPVPTDGPVAGLLKVLHRHCFRPAHIHFMIKAEGYESLTTSLYIKGDPFISSDAVFGVKNSLIVDVTENSPDASHPTKWWLLKYDFILPTRQESERLKASRKN